MAVPAIAMAGISAGLNIFGNIAGNAAITKTATSQYGAQKLFIDRDDKVLQTNAAYEAREVNNEIGMALTQLERQAAEAYAKATATRAESNIYGNSAARQQAVLDMKKALSSDSIMQEGEAKMVAVQNKMREINYSTQAKHVQNLQNYHNAMAQRKSTLSIVADGLAAGASGYSMGQGMELASAKLDAFNASSKASLNFIGK